MEYMRLWIGVGFAALLVAFLIAAFFRDKPPNQGQWAILRFLSALCAGAAGAFLTGEAIFRVSGELRPGLSVLIGGTAGVALFFTVWFGFEKYVAVAPTAPDATAFSIGHGWTFSSTAEALAKIDNSVVKFVGFSEAELNARIREQQLNVTSVADALQALGQLSAGPSIRDYSVAYTKPSYTLTVK